MSDRSNHLVAADAADARIVITGAGLVTSLGLSRADSWRRICAGDSGIVPLTALEQTPMDPRGGGQVPAIPSQKDEDSTQSRESRYLRLAIEQALTEAKASDALPYEAHRCGIAIGTTLHGMRAAGRFLREKSPEPLRAFLAPAVLRDSVIAQQLLGLSVTTCSACSSSLASVGLAMTLLRSGELDLVICGGYDPISEYAYAGFNALRLVAKGPIRPFCRDREGMKLGEGYAVLVLERETDARQRGAHALAQVLGFGESADAHHLTQPHPQGDGAFRAMRQAITAANVSPDKINLISAHATGTPDNDRGEEAALRQVFGASLPTKPIVAFKSALGHTLGGAGATELILAMMALEHGIIPPTAGASPTELEFADLRITAKAEPSPLTFSLNNSIGFGGANASVVLGRGDALPVVSRETLNGSPPRDVVITGIGVVLPGMVGNEAFVQRMISANAQPITQDAPPISDAELGELVNARRVRRLSDYVKLSLAATTEACRDAGLDDDQRAGSSAILGSTHGSANYSVQYYREIVEQGIDAANPMLFAEGVPNAAAAHLSMAFGFKGGCQTIIGSRTSGLDALRLAVLRVAMGEADRIIVSAAEERSEIVDSAYAHCGLHGGPGAGLPFSGNGFLTGCGAVTLVIESADAAAKRKATPRAKVIASAGAACLSLDAQQLQAQAQRVYEQLGRPAAVISSACGTAFDLIEAGPLQGRAVTLSSMAGHAADAFSVTPLAGIAAALLTGRLPRLRCEPAKLGLTATAATGNDRATNFAVLCTDFQGLLTGIRLAALPASSL
ncbi:MAG: beta-ketoacyl-[acyl-carrier-protein] synthase family protein [Phycisphaeraceae bacterium]